MYLPHNNFWPDPHFLDGAVGMLFLYFCGFFDTPYSLFLEGIQMSCSSFRVEKWDDDYGRRATWIGMEAMHCVF